MSHARAAIAGVLSAGIIVVIVQRDLNEDSTKIVMLAIVVIAVVLIPDLAEYIKRRKD